LFLIVASSLDVASINISEKIISNYPFQKLSEKFQDHPIYEAAFEGKTIHLVTLGTESIQAQNLGDFFQNPELVVFVSKHASVKGTPTLSVHVPGNLGEAEMGGLSRMVSVAPANPMRNALISMQNLRDKMQLQYEVSYECTHHGPSLNVPTMFVELGSTIEQWNDKEAAGIVAHAAINAIKGLGQPAVPTVLGIGGPHYNAKFTRLTVEDNVSFGHIIPKYALAAIDVQMISQCVERTMEKVEYAVLDWKGIKGDDKTRIKDILNSLNLPFKKA
jgi:D-aminoacyl-tRNA deacylase